MPERTKTRKLKTDTFLVGAIGVALDAVVDVARAGAVGEHSGFEMLDERLGIHYFSSTEPGYVGWRWGVTVARVPRGRKVTVCEVDLVPGEGSLLAPEWIPWEDRLLPGDVSREDVLPYRAVSVGIGLFIALIGLVNSGIIRKGVGTPVELGIHGSLAGWPALVFVVGLFATIVLYVRKVRGAILIGILSSTVLGFIIEAISPLGTQNSVDGSNPTGWGLTVPALHTSPVSLPDFATLGAVDFFGAFGKLGPIAVILLVFTLMLADFFDTMGTMLRC